MAGSAHRISCAGHPNRGAETRSTTENATGPPDGGRPHFRVTMSDVAQAYQAAHAADREGVFELTSEFDSVRERIEYLRRHPDLGSLQPELLEMAAQMSHESRDLAEIYSTERVERARHFLRQRQEEAEQMRHRVQAAFTTCSELRLWLERVEIDEDFAPLRSRA